MNPLDALRQMVNRKLDRYLGLYSRLERGWLDEQPRPWGVGNIWLSNI